MPQQQHLTYEELDYVSDSQQGSMCEIVLRHDVEAKNLLTWSGGWFASAEWLKTQVHYPAYTMVNSLKWKHSQSFVKSSVLEIVFTCNLLSIYKVLNEQ